ASGQNPLKPSAPRFHLPADAITTPAFWVDHHLRIGWVKMGQENRLARAIDSELADDPFGTVFDIMLRASLKELIFDWQPLFSFTYRFLQAVTPPTTFERLAPMVSLTPKTGDHQQHPRSNRDKASPIDSCPFDIATDGGQMQRMRIYGIVFSGGTLFILDKERWPDDLSGKKAVITSPDPQADVETAPGKTPFSVISARLDDSRTIVETLLPETYFKHMTRIWHETDKVLERHGGQRAKRGGTEVQYIIPRHTNTDPAYLAICCAIELRERMHAIEASLKADGGWFTHIRLNIGISSGKDHLNQDDPTASMAFMLPGGAADQAFHLSAIAHGGAIWITKSAFSHLTPQQIKQITFGIYRDDRLVPHIFAQVSDLPHAVDTPPPGRGIRSLSVTRIIDLQLDRADLSS
ncbi:MAG: hypothetical protein WBY88_02190, partial [Desulfosarcina sp.]